ncbi:PA0069 family radical SAM protein [Chiayiivirga flava]|uniref:DNA repair photolyase n=1 Tax=Chiayiivirga flava TaxID=659595 RepID=A0A7W8D7F5_9GAMM|nr:PA0069 family radical SAM protein [Chiayiivirga flava]MBB5207663.1 DNA repair photolyase [Chiayiivirga flava]
MQHERIKGRGSALNLEGRYIQRRHEAEDDGWFVDGEPASPPRTTVTDERARSIVSHNQSPDLGFTASINPYRGCEHGCSYCYARPSHSYLELSPGLDFETKLYAKTNAAELLRAELARPGYVVSPIALGANTDPYQPIEKRYRITRQILEVLHETRHPVSIVTKNAMVERDLDLLAPMARDNLAKVYLSVTTLDNRLAARMEPRASAPYRKIEALRRLRDAGVPTGVMFAPVIPMINDMELEAVVEAAADAGARSAGYVMLRLPHELKDLFRDWLALHFPDRAAHVMSLIRQSRGGKDYDADFATRQSGTGVFAQLAARRFRLAVRKAGFGEHGRNLDLDTTKFVKPRKPSPQGELFL